MHQDKNVGVAVASVHHRHASSNSRDVSVAERQEHMAKSKVCKGESWVHSMTGESPDKHDDQFMVYGTHTVDALKSSDIRVSVCIDAPCWI